MIMRDLLLNSVAIQPVDTLPADGSSSPVVLYNGVVYLWGDMIELNGPDTLSLPIITNMNTDDWVFDGLFSDLNVLGNSNSVFLICRVAGLRRLYAQISALNVIQLYFIDLSGAVVTTITVTDCIVNNKQFRLRIEKVGRSCVVSVTVNGVVCTASGTISSSFNGDGITQSIITDENVATRPIQTCCVTQSVNGVLIDHLPCDDGTGTVVRNIVTPARAGSLNDQLAWGMGWRAIT